MRGQHSVRAQPWRDVRSTLPDFLPVALPQIPTYPIRTGRHAAADIWKCVLPFVDNRVRNRIVILFPPLFPSRQGWAQCLACRPSKDTDMWVRKNRILAASAYEGDS